MLKKALFLTLFKSEPQLKNNIKMYWIFHLVFFAGVFDYPSLFPNIIFKLIKKKDDNFDSDDHVLSGKNNLLANTLKLIWIKYTI